MAPNNMNSANDDSPEDVEKKGKNTTTMSDLYRDYAKHKLDQKVGKAQFIDDIMSSSTLDSTMVDEIRNFAGEEGKYDHLEITADKLNIGSLKREVRGAFIGLDNKRKNVNALLLRSYSVPDKGNAHKLTTEINKLEESQLDSILRSEISREDFIEKVFSGSQIPEKKDFLNFLEDSGLGNKIQSKLTSLPDGLQKDEIKEALQNLAQLNFNNSAIDIKIFLELDVLSKAEKKEILYTFVPLISLAEVKEYSLLSDGDIEKYKKKIVKGSKLTKDLNGATIDALVLGLRDEEMFITSRDISEGSLSTDTLNDIIASGLAQNLSEDFQQKRSEILSQAPQSFSAFKISMQEDASLKNQVLGIEKIEKGSLLEIELEVGDTKQNHLIKIVSTDISVGSEEKGISYESYKRDGDGGDYILEQRGATKSYNDFISFFKNPHLKKSVVSSKQEAEQRTGAGGDIILTDPNKIPDFRGKDSIDGDHEAQMSEIADLRREYNTIKDIEDKKDDAAALKSKIDRLENKAENTRDFNSNLIKDKLDQDIDPDGASYGLESGTSFVCKESKGIAIFTIAKINHEKITLTNNQQIPLGDFHTSFKRLKAKRFAKVNDQDSFVSDLGDEKELGKYWNDYEVDNGKIKHKKNKSEPGYQNIEFLTQGDVKGKAIKIHSISGNSAEIQYGEITGDKPDKPEDDPQKFKPRQKETVSLAELSYLIKRDQLGPKDNFTAPDVDSPIKQKSHFLSWLFQAKSIQELVQGGEIGVEAIKNMLKEGRDSHASHAALGMFGWMGKELKNDLKSRVQSEEKKSQDEYIDRLKALDSFEATRLIESWLLNKTCPEYKQNAAMIFMYQEYGSLYTKEKYASGKFVGGLGRLRGTNLWYKALGGTIGDESWQYAKKQAEKDKMPFTEEAAVFALVKKQCVNGQRRSRVHKEIKGLWPKGIEDEIDKGYKDAKDTRTAQQITDVGFSELEEGTNANFVGWAKKNSERGGPMHVVYEMPIVAMFSGAINNFDQRIIIKMKDMYKEGSTTPMIMFDFVSNTDQIEFFCKVVLEITKSLEGEGSDMYKEALAIYKDRGTRGEWKEKKKIRRTREFYKKHGERLTRALHMVNNDASGNGKFAKEDNIVLLEASKNPPNEILKRYHHHMREEVAEDFDFTKESYMNDWLKDQGISGIYAAEAMEKALSYSTTSGFRHTTVSKIIWNEVVDGVRAVKRNNTLDRADKLTVLVSKYKDMISGLYRASGENPRSRDALLSTADLTKNELKELGISKVNLDQAFVGKGYKEISNASQGSAIYQDLYTRAEAYLDSSGFDADIPQDVFDIVNDTPKTDKPAANESYSNPYK